MILDFRDLAGLAGHPETVVIVGSGAAGLALALALCERGLPVVVIESGGDVTDPEAIRRAAHLNDGVVAGLPYELASGRARVLGGTTELWHGQCMRLHEIDLRERPWVPHSGWPLSLKDLSADYAAAETWLGVTGLGYDEVRWNEHPRLEQLAWDESRLQHDFTEYAPDPCLGRRHRARLASLASVEVVLNATASRVLLDGSGAATGVEVVGADCSHRIVQGRRIVLAAGAIENARLLQLSDPAGIGLGTGREHTGRFLLDHPVVLTAEVKPYDYRVLQDRFVALHKGRRQLFPKLRLAPAAQEAHGLLDATAVFLHEHHDPSFAAARRLLRSARRRRRPEDVVRDSVLALQAPTRIVRDTYRRYARGLATSVRPAHVWLQLWLEQAPDPRSRVTLDDSVDALGLRRARVAWRCGDQELETSRRMTRWIAEDLARLRLADVHELPAMHDDGAWRAAVRDVAHPAGTTRMSLRPDKGVVDADLAVHGVHGLYVVGSSVFPTSGYANPTLTIAALALRLARHLSGASTMPPPPPPASSSLHDTDRDEAADRLADVDVPVAAPA